MSWSLRLLTLLTFVGFAPACASMPPQLATFPPSPQVRAARHAPPLGSPERARFDRDSDVQVFVIEVDGATAPGDADRALALSQLLVHAVDAVVDEWHPLPLALGSDGAPRSPRDLAASTARFFLGGRLTRAAPPAAHGPLELTLWLMDRANGRVHSRTLYPDLPRLMAPRNALADLMSDADRATNELIRSDMTWYEDLDLAQLAQAGRLIGALHDARVGASERATLARAADSAAPWSYLVAVAVAEQELAAGRCDAATISRLTKVLSLNRVVPVSLAAVHRTCALASELDPDAPALPAWSVRSGAHCRIGAKGLTSVASTRGPAIGRVEPGQGFVTGLGGVYRGESCAAGFAVGEHGSEQLGTPFLRASLELEAAFYFYAARDVTQSIRRFRRALATADAGGDACMLQLLGAEATLGLADLAIEDGRGSDAREHLARAREAASRCGDARMLGRSFNSEALLEQAQSHFDVALKQLALAQAAFARIGDTTNLVVVEANFGVTWLHLGRLDRAIPHLETALAGKRRLLSAGGVGVLLENLGVAELARANRDAAAGYFGEALRYARDPNTVATLHVQLARLALARGDHVAAARHMDLARDSSQRAHSKVLDAIIEQTDAAVSIDVGRYESALTDFHDALALRREIGDRAGEGITLSLLMALSERMERPAIAILYGKLSIAAHQDVRAAADAIDPDTAREFLATRADTYRALANLLVAQGRLVEAERVLALLKQDEVRQWTRDGAPQPALGVPLTTAERALDKRYSEVADKVMQLGREHGVLAAKWPRSPEEEARLDALRHEVEAANLRFSEFLAGIARSGDALRRSKKLEDLSEGTSIGPDLGELGKGFVAVYTLVAADMLHLIVVSPDAQVARSVPLQEGLLNGLVAALRQGLQDPARDPRAAAKELYDYLLAPIERDLVQADAKVILWSLDRSLRYVPMGALFDGKRYALERWAMAVFTPASMARMKDLPQPRWRALALGVTSEHPPFPALPGVADELVGVEGVLPGLKALDGAFTHELFLAQLTRRWPVVHVASHFSFQPGDKDASYLLLGDGSRFTVGELERLPNLFQGVDLLTLSACNTATSDLGGDGTEVESFAVLAQRKGARAVFASLWPVADPSTSALMRRFYALHATAPNKLEALRTAQLELLRGTVAAAPGTTRTRPLTLPGGAPVDAPAPLDPSLAGWRHPYYWAPFILVGNVR